jgi:hypothetical protein
MADAAIPVIAPLSGVRGNLTRLPNGSWLYRIRRVGDGRKFLDGFTDSTPWGAVRAFDLAVWTGRVNTFAPAWRRAIAAGSLPIPPDLASDHQPG